MYSLSPGIALMAVKGTPLYLPRNQLQLLVDVLHGAGYDCVGPRVRDGAITYEGITHAAELPQGMHDTQSPGQYRLHAGDSPRLFAWANGPQAVKPLVFRPRETVWRVRRNDRGRLKFVADAPRAPLTAVIGVRACDLAALKMLDEHYRGDTLYRARRKALLLIAVNCTHPAQTCFCASTGDGPRADTGFDLALDELEDGYVIYAGTAKGRAIADSLPQHPAAREQRRAGKQASRHAAQQQARALPSRNLRDPLFANLHHPRWHDVAARCLSCGNCTSVCPTCFCHSQNEAAHLDGTESEHYRQWDSCFTQGHSYIHGLVVRADTETRYRQWLTHKLGGWHDQFGRSGCVGCGRCIAWCPVGIDITEEAAVICGDGL
jgi:sulfhydrogenase subunit beta (sulfur reductase)